MHRAFFLRLALLLTLLASAPAWGQWATPVIDGFIASGEYGSNNSLSNAGNTGQTWYMTWDANNLYVGIVNANLSEGAVIYVTGNPQNPVTCCSNADGNLTGFNYDGTDFSSLPFRAKFVTYFKGDTVNNNDVYREYRNSDGSGNWTSSTSNYGLYASNPPIHNTREVAIPWTAINSGGIPSSFVFFGYLTSSGGYVYGEAPSDNPGAFIGTSATYTQYYAIVNTGNGTSTPPFSLEQPSGFGADVKSRWLHDTFDPFYRDQEGAVAENGTVNLRFRTGHSDVDGVNVRAYLFDTATGVTTGPVDTSMPFDQNITIGATEYDVWKATLTMPSATTVYYYKFHIFKGSTNGWYSDDYLDDNDNVDKDGTGAASDVEPFPAFQSRFTIRTSRLRHGCRTRTSITSCPTASATATRPTTTAVRAVPPVVPFTTEASRLSPITSGTPRFAIRATRAQDASASTATSSTAAICSASRTNWTISSRWAWTRFT